MATQKLTAIPVPSQLIPNLQEKATDHDAGVCPTCDRRVRLTNAQRKRLDSVVELVEWALEARKRYQSVIEMQEQQEATAANRTQIPI